MPTPIASPPSDITLSDTLFRYSGPNVARIETGIEIAMMSVGL